MTIYDPDASDKYCPSGTNIFSVAVSSNISEDIWFSVPRTAGIYVTDNSSSSMTFLCTAIACNGHRQTITASSTYSGLHATSPFLVSVVVSDQGSCGSTGDTALVASSTILAQYAQCDQVPLISFETEVLQCQVDAPCLIDHVSFEETCTKCSSIVCFCIYSQGQSGD